MSSGLRIRFFAPTAYPVLADAREIQFAAAHGRHWVFSVAHVLEFDPAGLWTHCSPSKYLLREGVRNAKKVVMRSDRQVVESHRT